MPLDSGSVGPKLTTAEVEQFRDVLLGAFSLSEFEQVVYFGLEEDLSVLVVRGPAMQMVADLVRWANNHDKVDALLAQARKANPGNRKLQKFEADMKIARKSGPDAPISKDPTAKIVLNMACIPTAYYEVLDCTVYPLLTCTIAPGATDERVRVTAFIEGYSAQAVETVVVGPQTGSQVIKLKPILSPDAVTHIVQIRAASLNVRIDVLGRGDLDHKSMRVWMLARTAAPLAVQDLDSRRWQDMSQFLGTFVTPKQPDIQAYLNKIAVHLGAQLTGYDGDVEAQVRAVYETLKEDAKLVYAQSSDELNTEANMRLQHVRLPCESLATRTANCADGAILFASMLLAFGIHPALVVMPKHMVVAWETAPESGKWHYLDTTKLDTHSYDMARQFGQVEAEACEKESQPTGDGRWFRRWPLKQLREELKIFPVE